MMNDRCTEGALNPARAEGLRPSAAWKMERTTESRAGGGGLHVEAASVYISAESRAGGGASDERNGQPAGMNLSGELPERGVRT